jgi:flagellar protein FliS
MNAIRAYKESRLPAASKERLMVMLLEVALRHIRAGAAALESRRALAAVSPLTRASDLVAELLATLDPGQDQALCNHLADVYDFVLARILRACASFDAAAAREAERAFAPIVDAFAQAVAAVERGEVAVPAAQ